MKKTTMIMKGILILKSTFFLKVEPNKFNLFYNFVKKVDPNKALENIGST